MGSLQHKRPVSIGSASGAITDRPENLLELAKTGDVDFIVGDWMSEYNMAIRGKMVAKRVEGVIEDHVDAFEEQFVHSVVDALPLIESRGIKLAVNAGASDTERLHDVLRSIIDEAGLKLTVAWVDGDQVLQQVQNLAEQGHEFRNITTGQLFESWDRRPLYSAQCYLGSWGIVEALRQGADIVVCGRVSDAAPTIAAAAYWHGWSRDCLSELAHSLIAGHLIECSYYVTGGNFSGFKSMAQGITSSLLNLPIVRVNHTGTFTVETHNIPGRSGGVTVESCRSQLLYELQGKRYYNSDVVAVIDQIKIDPASDDPSSATKNGGDKVYVHNIGYLPPPPTTKVGITAHGGYQAEVHYFMTGLDIEEKAALLERQLREYLDVDSFSLLKFTTTGTAASNPSSQDAATVDLRIFAQADDEAALSKKNFLDRCFNIVMCTYPGATFAVDIRQGFPKPYNEYFVTIIPQDLLDHNAHIPAQSWSKQIPAPTKTAPYLYEQEVDDDNDNDNDTGPSLSSSSMYSLQSFGPTRTAPLGYVVHARSGDKGSDCNVGFHVRHPDEYRWLRALLSVSFVKQLLQNDYSGGRVERFELPNIYAVHFLLKDHLDRGVAASSTYDVLGKNVAEYLRSKHVQIPEKFLARGRI